MQNTSKSGGNVLKIQKSGGNVLKMQKIICIKYTSFHNNCYIILTTMLLGSQAKYEQKPGPFFKELKKASPQETCAYEAIKFNENTKMIIFR